MFEVCGTKNFRDLPPISNYFFPLLPCSFAFAKALMFCSLFISTLIVSKMGELFHSKNGWLAGVFVFLTPIWVSEFMKFEDDFFSYPVLFAAMYFFLKGVKEKKSRYQGLALALAILGSLIWKGGVFYIFAFALGFVYALLIAIPIIALEFNKVFGSIIPKLHTFENMPVIGVFYFYGLWLGLLETKKEYLPQLLFFVILTFINQKFILHALPLLAIGVVGVFNEIPIYAKNLKNRFKIVLPFKNLMYVILISLLFSSIIGYSITLDKKLPNPATWNAIDYAMGVAQTSNKKLKNDWSLGYWVLWKGGSPSAYGGYNKQDYPYYQGSIAITFEEINYCKKLKTWETNWKNISVFDCPNYEERDSNG